MRKSDAAQLRVLSDMAADPTKAARAMLDTGKKHLKMTRKQISLNTLEKLLRKQLCEPNSGGSSTIFNNSCRFFSVNLKVEEIFSTFTFTTFTFCNCLMKNDLCHSLFVYHLKRMRLHRKLVKYMFQYLSMWGSLSNPTENDTSRELWKTIPTLLSQTVPRIGTFQMWKAHKQCFMQRTNDAKKSKMNNQVRSKLNFWWAIYWQARSESREIVLVGTISGSDKKVATSFRRLARYLLPSHYTHSAHCYLRDEPKQRQQKDVGVCVFTEWFPDKESLLRWIQMFSTLVD